MLHDLHAFARSILQRPLELGQAGVCDGIAVKEELVARIRKAVRQEFPQQRLVDIALHRATADPAEAAVDQDPHPVRRLQLDDLEAIEADQVTLRFRTRELVVAHDRFIGRATEDQPGDHEQLRISGDFLLLAQAELILRRAPLHRALDECWQWHVDELANQIHASERQIATREQALDARLTQFQLPRHVLVGVPGLLQGALQLQHQIGTHRHDIPRSRCSLGPWYCQTIPYGYRCATKALNISPCETLP